jgi:hypothetical protein
MPPGAPDSGSPCPGNSPLFARVDLDRFGHVNATTRRLISGWYGRASSKLDVRPRDSFEPFIFCWIAFNGWAACVTDLDTDWMWRDAIASSPMVHNSFLDVMARDRTLAQHAHTFHGLLPMFVVQDIRRRGLRGDSNEPRESTRRRFLEAGVWRLPRCWDYHDNGQTVPLDWPHTLVALYQVRCNLFHGDKDAHSEMDQSIVFAGLQVLTRFLGQAGYLSETP